MKNTRSRSIIISIMTFVFIGGLCFYIYQFIINAEKWALYPSNPHTNNNVLEMGTIKDRNDVVLAQTINDKRVYNDNPEIRKAMLHVVGDNSKSISTAIQTTFRSILWNYNLATGLTPPDSDSTEISRDIKLTLDSNICLKALKELGNRKGAVVVYNYKTGEIICMASSPTFDPESPPDFTNETVQKEYNGAYMNKVLSGYYPPGSIFKVVTGASAINNLPDIYSQIFTCQQIKIIDGQKIRCEGYHGDINLQDAMAQSCNIAFADIAIELGKEKMTRTANEMGFNNSFDISGISTQPSKFDLSNIKSDADLGWAGIGQYENVLINPMHAAIIMGAVANEGTPTMPRLINSITNSKGATKEPRKTGTKLLNQNTANKIKELMRYTVTSNYKDSSFTGIKDICAKTGTAEVGTGKEPHGWVIGFSQDPNTPYAFAVIVENGGYGARCAIPIASSVLNEIVSKKTKNPNNF